MKQASDRPASTRQPLGPAGFAGRALEHVD
jgi:hypothetical protein